MVVTLLATAWILCREGRPIFFAHQRVGKDGRLFSMPKLRTMHKQTDPYHPCAAATSLITKPGRFLRRHRIDELPQLLCVLTGSMSMVGPRPEIPNIVAEYEAVHKQRLYATPGITGLWQLMGSRNVPIHHDMTYDLYYIHNASLWLDLKILAMTFSFVLRPK
jgi:putative colanic acid biosynthesis UDP-glucose lipid carrier transferase